MNINVILNKVSNPVVVKAVVDGDMQNALRNFFEVKEMLEDDFYEWPDHEHAATIESFFDIEEINGNEIVFSTSIYFDECYTLKAVGYIKWLFRKLLGKHFTLTEVHHKVN